MRWLCVVVALALAAAGCGDTSTAEVLFAGEADMRALPEPSTDGVSLVEALAGRRSVREYSDRPLTDAQLSDLLWAAQGVTSPAGRRTAPSAGALYPLEMYLVTPEAWYRYEPDGHALELQGRGDLRPDLSSAALGQDAVANGAAVFVVAAVYARTEGKYGDRAERYVQLEAGHAAQNLLLQAVSLGLGAVPIGAFRDGEVRAVMQLPGDHEPLYLIPVGAPE